MHERSTREKLRLHNHLLDLVDDIDSWSNELNRIIEGYQNLTSLV